MEDQKKLIEIIEGLKEVRTQTKTKVSDEILFQQSVDIFISDRISNHRQGQKFIPFTKQGADKPNFPAAPATLNPEREDTHLATPNQISVLKKMGYDKDTSKLTKYAAWVLIKGGRKSWNKQ